MLNANWMYETFLHQLISLNCFSRRTHLRILNAIIPAILHDLFEISEHDNRVKCEQLFRVYSSDLERNAAIRTTTIFSNCKRTSGHQ